MNRAQMGDGLLEQNIHRIIVPAKRMEKHTIVPTLLGGCPNRDRQAYDGNGRPDHRDGRTNRVTTKPTRSNGTKNGGGGKEGKTRTLSTAETYWRNGDEKTKFTSTTRTQKKDNQRTDNKNTELHSGAQTLELQNIHPEKLVDI